MKRIYEKSKVEILNLKSIKNEMKHLLEAHKYIFELETGFLIPGEVNFIHTHKVHIYNKVIYISHIYI